MNKRTIGLTAVGAVLCGFASYFFALYGEGELFIETWAKAFSVLFFIGFVGNAFACWMIATADTKKADEAEISDKARLKIAHIKETATDIGDDVDTKLDRAFNR